jgi:hypothetical protein
MTKLEVESALSGFRAWLEAKGNLPSSSDERDVQSLLTEYLSSEGIEDINKYVGDIESLRSSKVHQALTNELTRLGVKPKRGAQATRQADVLERYKTVPLHAIFLYTSEDQKVERYISENWGALDTLSGDFCDIHQSVDQFQTKEDAYDFIENLSVIRESNFDAYSQLPGLFFWDSSGASQYIPFGPKASLEGIKTIVRSLFEEIRKNPKITSVSKVKKRMEMKERSIKSTNPKRQSIWSDLLGFLLAFVIVVGTVVLASQWVSPLVLGVVLISAILAFLLIGAFVLKRQDELSEANFMELIAQVIRSLPFLRRSGRAAGDDGNAEGRDA